MSEQIPETTNERRNPLVLLVGFIVLGIAIGVVLFGRDWFDGSSDAAIESAPGLDTAQQTVAEIPGSLPGLQVGETAPDFTLSDLDGNAYSLSDFRGKPVMINFWATWCGPCRVEMPEMQKAFEQYGPEGFTILALNQDESAETVQDFFYDQLNLTFTPLLDNNSIVAADYGAFGIYPTSFFIDSDGVVAAVHRGPATLEQIEAYLSLADLQG